MVRGHKNPLHFGLPLRLKRARLDAGLKRLPLAEKAGVSTATERQIETKERLPTVGTIARLATALGTSAAWLAYGLGEQHSEGAADSCDGMAERLHSARTDRGHTRTQLARLAELNPGTIAKIEGGGQAGVETIEQLANALGVSPGWLAYGVGPQVVKSRRSSRTLAAD